MIIEVGRLTQEVKTTVVNTDGTEHQVVNNRLAINYGKDRAAFIDISAWDGCGEVVANHFKKGDEIYIVGEIRVKQYKINDDKSISIPYINVSGVKFTHGRQKPDDERGAI
jgi:single-stranded DNA-binding protein